MVIRPKTYFLTLLVFVSLFLIVLNPYFVFGRPGAFAVMLLAVYSLIHGINAFLWRKIIGKLFILLFLSLVGLISSVAHGITQFNHVAAVISLFAIVFASHGLWLICQEAKISTNRLIFLILVVVLFNSAIIVLELNFDALRSAIESYLDPLESASINYSDGYRFRGFASSGGANLSLLIPAAVTLALYLFGKRIIGVWLLVITISVLVFSATVIGRTGLILLPIPFLLYLLFSLKLMDARRIIAIGGFFLLAFLFLQYFFSFGREFLSEKFGEDFLYYSFEFMFEGKSGLEQEGTAGAIAGFLQVLPTNWAEIFFGYGFYGGSYFEPWTDSGLSRMFLSIGYFFGIVFYCVVFRMYSSVFRFDGFLGASFLAILTIGETKEALLFTGFASRVFIIVLVFVVLDKAFHEVTTRYHRAR